MRDERMIDDRAALLRAVTDSPDDPTPRLIFADWLEEHGESDAAAILRGERGAQAVRLAVELPRFFSAVALPILTICGFLRGGKESLRWRRGRTANCLH